MYILEWVIQWTVVLLSLFLLFKMVLKPGTKEWLLVYFSKAFVSIFFGVIVVEQGLLEYPVRFLSAYFETSILFEYLAFPALCVAYNQTSYSSKLNSIFLQAVLYSGGMTAVEVVLEQYTAVIEYHHWTWYYTLTTITMTMLLVRGFIGLVHKLENAEQKKNPQA
jgi:hypothetical protein